MRGHSDNGSDKMSGLLYVEGRLGRVPTKIPTKCRDGRSASLPAEEPTECRAWVKGIV